MRKSLATAVLSIAGGFIGFHFASLTAVSAANHPPYLSGGGAAIPNAVVFPENATPASVSASSGSITIAPGGSNQNINLRPSGTGLVLINKNAAALQTPAAGTLLQIGQVDGTQPIFSLDSFGAQTQILFRRSNGTGAAPTAVQSGDILGTINWRGYGATAMSSGPRAQVRAITSENWTDAAQGVSVSVATTPIGGVTAAEAARFFGSTGFSVGSTTDPGAGVINANSGFSMGGTAGVSSTLSLQNGNSVAVLGGIVTALTSHTFTTVALANQSATVGPTALQVDSAKAPAGLYRITTYGDTHTAGTGNVVLSVSTNDGIGVKTFSITVALTAANVGTSTFILRTDGTTDITYTATYTGTGAYDVYMQLERVS